MDMAIMQWAETSLVSNGYIINGPSEHIRTTP